MSDSKASKPLPWTKEEDEELMRLRAMGKTYAQCAEAIGRTLGGCESRWRTLHSPKSRPAPSMWTSEEDALLAELWHVLPVEQISERIGRSVKGIYRRATRLGLTSGEFQGLKVPWTPEEDRVLREHVGTMTYAEIGLLLGRTDKSVKARALHLCLRGGPKPRLPKQKAHMRKCHDCGRPTSDYRCAKCWAKLREKYKYEE